MEISSAPDRRRVDVRQPTGWTVFAGVQLTARWEA